MTFSAVRRLAAVMAAITIIMISGSLTAADFPAFGFREDGGIAGKQGQAPEELWRQAFLEWDSLQRYGQEADFCRFLEKYYLFPDWVERAGSQLNFQARTVTEGLNLFRVEIEGVCGKEPLVAFEPEGAVISHYWENGAFRVHLRPEALVTMTLRTAWGAVTEVVLDATYQEITAEISLDTEQQLLRIENIRGGMPGLQHVLRIEEGDRFIDTLGIAPGNSYLSVNRLPLLRPGRAYRFRIGDSRQTFFSEGVTLQVPAGAGMVSQSWLLVAMLLAGCNLLTVVYYEVLKKH